MNIRPDIIIAWPRNNDYPLWRQYIHDNRAKFNEIIVVFTETHYGEDYRDFLRQVMFKDHVLCIDNPPIKSGEDWRNVAIHQALLHSYNAPWIFFTEQDFEIKEGFWEMVDASVSMGVKTIAVKDDRRLHPCCWFIRRDLLMSLDQNFGVVPDHLDHFGLIQKQLENNNEPIGILPENTYYHMNGLSQNLTLIYNGDLPNWRVEEFNKYLAKSLQVLVPLDDRYITLVKRYLKL